jgi:hypothetical protein
MWLQGANDDVVEIPPDHVAPPLPLSRGPKLLRPRGLYARPVPDADDHHTPSPILRYLASQLRNLLPPDQVPKLDAFEPLIEQSSPHGDFHRAAHCATWAVELAGRSEPTHRRKIPTELGEVVRVLRDMEFGISFGFMVGDVGRTEDSLRGHFHDRDKSSGLREDLKVSMVDDALAVAQQVGDSEGWDSVPWEQLLRDVVHAKTH